MRVLRFPFLLPEPARDRHEGSLVGGCGLLNRSFRTTGGAARAPTLPSPASRERGILSSIATRQAEDVLGDVGQDQVGADRGHLVEARFTVFAFDVVFLGEAEASMGLETGLGCGP